MNAPYEINLGNLPGDKTGTPARIAGQWINEMNAYLFEAVKANIKQVFVYNVPDPSTLPAPNNSLEDAVAQAVNNMPQFLKKTNEIIQFQMPVVTTPTELVEVYTFFLSGALGETYLGQNGTQISGGNLTKGLRSRVRQDIVELGDLGAGTVSDAINTSGPYTERAFTCTINGVFKYYVYNGGAAVIGQGNTQTTEADFTDLTAQPAPPDLNNYVENKELDAVMYEDAKFYLTDTLANVSITGQEEFVLIEADQDQKYYFGQKDTSPVIFNNCRLTFRSGGFRWDFAGTPTAQGGYNFYELGDSEGPNKLGITPAGDSNSFSFYRKFSSAAGQITASDVAVDSTLLSQTTGATQEEVNEDFDTAITANEQQAEENRTNLASLNAEAVKTTAQTFTTPQQKQARENINASSTTTTLQTTVTTTLNASDVINDESQAGKRVVIDNAANDVVVNIDIALDTTYMKTGTGKVTFVSAAGRTLEATTGIDELINPNDVAYVGSIGTTDRLYINVIEE